MERNAELKRTELICNLADCITAKGYRLNHGFQWKTNVLAIEIGVFIFGVFSLVAAGRRFQVEAGAAAVAAAGLAAARALRGLVRVRRGEQRPALLLQPRDALQELEAAAAPRSQSPPQGTKKNDRNAIRPHPIPHDANRRTNATKKHRKTVQF